MATNQNSNTSNRGFASMDEDKQREIASMGGKAAHESGHAHEFTPEEAREAGRKGGEAVSQDRQHMADIGRKGGEASGGGNRSGGNQGGGNQGGGSQGGGSQGGGGASQRGGTSEQHAEAGRQSHKNR
jgi:hypothetical protein